jgi:hypothetical protein
MGRKGRIAATGLLLALATAADADAAPIKPTRFNDPAPNGCKPANCSLREAITQANKRKGKDKIVLATGTYKIQLAENANEDNAGGDFDVKGPVRIVGKGSSATIVDGNGVSRVFSLLKDPSKSIEKLKVTGGAAPDGAGIFVSPPTNPSGTSRQTLKNLIVQGNAAEFRGGGIYTSQQRLLVSRTVVAGNTAATGGGGMYLGAAPLQGSGSTPALVRSSTFVGNIGGVGAGVYSDGANEGEAVVDPRVDLLNSTVALNSATVSGGGMAAVLGGFLAADHTTVAYNSADSDNAGGGNGGGIYQSTNAFFRLENSLVKENFVGSSGGGPSCAGEFTFTGMVTPQNTPAGFCVFGPGSATSSEPLARIGNLANNGGPTPTIEIFPDSAANGWSDGICPQKDQRGEPRPATDCDAGAYERP